MIEQKIYRYDDKQKENGIWVNADKWMKNNYRMLQDHIYEIGELDDDDIEDEWGIHRDDRVYNDRHYGLFGILAGVRMSDVPRISDPKGIPKDTSPEIRYQVKRYGDDGHSHSYLSLHDLKDFDWDQTINDTAQLTKSRYDKIIANDPDDILHLGEWKESFGLNEPVAKADYRITLREICQDFLDKTLSRMEGLKDNSQNDHDIRIVFWFDN